MNASPTHAAADRPEPGMARGRIHGVTGWLTAVLAVTWALSSLWYPFGWDQGILSWVGREILDGGMPFRDAFDLKGPAAYYFYALAQALFGENLWGIRLLDLIGLGVTAWLTARLVNHLCAPGTGQWAAALLVLWYAGLTFWHTAQPDGFVAFLLALGFLPLLQAGAAHGYARSALAGLVVGCAASIKPNYAVFLLVPAIFLLGQHRGNRNALARHLAVTLLGMTLVPVACIGWFALRGALDALLEVHVAYNLTTYSSGGSLELGKRLQGTFDYLLTGNVIVVLLPAVVLGTAHLWKSRPVVTVALVTWSVLAFAGVVLQNKFFDYQWAPFLVPAAILGAAGIHAALTPRTAHHPGAARTPGMHLGHALFFVVLGHAAIHPAFEVANWLTYMGGLRDRASYYDTFGVPGNDLRMVQHIETIAGEEDRLLVMAWNTEILYMSGLETVSRFGFSLPFWMGDGSVEQQRYRGELMQALNAHPPEFIVVGEQALPLVGRAVSLDDFPVFRDFLHLHYRADARFGDLELYRLKPDTRLPAG